MKLLFGAKTPTLLPPPPPTGDYWTCHMPTPPVWQQWQMSPHGGSALKSVTAYVSETWRHRNHSSSTATGVWDRPHGHTEMSGYGKKRNNYEDIQTKTNSVDWVRERTVPTEWPPLVGEVSVNLCGYRVLRSQHNGSLQPYSQLCRPEPLLFCQVAPQLYSRGWVNTVPDHYFSENLVVPGIEPGPLDL
jgi:hypothetical protein